MLTLKIMPKSNARSMAYVRETSGYRKKREGKRPGCQQPEGKRPGRAICPGECPTPVPISAFSDYWNGPYFKQVARRVVMCSLIEQIVSAALCHVLAVLKKHAWTRTPHVVVIQMWVVQWIVGRVRSSTFPRQRSAYRRQISSYSIVIQRYRYVWSTHDWYQKTVDCNQKRIISTSCFRFVVVYNVCIATHKPPA